MAQEIERKFLVKGDFKNLAVKSTRIIQGYLSSVPERTVRVRVNGDKGFITIKGIGSTSGASRFEWEKEISTTEANELLAICEPGVIDKTRFLVKAGSHTFEVDEFYGEHNPHKFTYKGVEDCNGFVNYIDLVEIATGVYGIEKINK